MPESLKYTPPGNVVIDGTPNPIALGKAIPLIEYTINLYEFTNERGETSDGAIFEIKPHGSTGIMKSIDPQARFDRIAIEGQGWFLGVSPEGEVVSFEVNADGPKMP